MAAGLLPADAEQISEQQDLDSHEVLVGFASASFEAPRGWVTERAVRQPQLGSLRWPPQEGAATFRCGGWYLATSGIGAGAWQTG